MIKKVYLARTTDEELWKNSSSGGVFWNFAENIINNHHGICYGAKFDSDFSVVHGRADNLLDAEKFRGSKYLQSDMKDVYQSILIDLKNGQTVLFSGTPCQVAAVKKIVPTTLLDNLVLVEFLCHGVPSPKIFKDYLDFQKQKYRSDISDVKFRGKKLKNSVQDMYIKFISGKEYKSFGTQDIFYKLFLNEYIIRPSCANCHFANGDRQADVTISDYWGEQKNIPDNFHNKSGLSCVFINTDKGEKCWQESMKNLIIAESDIFICSQVTLKHPVPMSKNRNGFWELYLKQGLIPAFEKYFGSYKKMCHMRTIKNFINETGIIKVIRKIKGIKR